MYTISDSIVFNYRISMDVMPGQRTLAATFF